MSISNIGLSQMMPFFSSHYHDNWEIILNRCGNGYMIINNNKYFYKTGTIICVPPNAAHTKYSEAQFQDIYINLSKFPLANTYNLNDVIVFQDDAEKSFETLLLMANRIFFTKQKNCKKILNSLYDAMEQLLISWHEHTPDNVEIEKLKNKIATSFTDPQFTIGKLLSEGSYCKDHLRRLFKQATGVTPLDYLTELRINYAKNLMDNNRTLNHNIAEICMMSGFYDAAYFSRVFKKITNCAPSKYLRSHGTNNN
ncbi:MAG: AraC family transcriptional regulator [Oscillospiraceae bacterium]|nr:AraC family transcriptional regulator [Oscillospiraceae bacterium]